MQSSETESAAERPAYARAAELGRRGEGHCRPCCQAVRSISAEVRKLLIGTVGLDALVFTSGIGEHAPAIRRRVCENATWLGVSFDDAGNAAGGPRGTKAGSKASAWVIPTDEDLMIARHTWRLIRDNKTTIN
jgi:acetate kinase